MNWNIVCTLIVEDMGVLCHRHHLISLCYCEDQLNIVQLFIDCIPYNNPPAMLFSSILFVCVAVYLLIINFH